MESLPGYLLTETQNINVIKDDTLEVEIYMKQKTRDLLFELTVKEGDPDRISNITGTLSGIAGSFDLSSQRICGEAMNTSFPFARTNDKITAHTRLLGTTGLKQSLRIDLTFTDGSSQTIENDLTDLLKNFNDDMPTPMYITGDLMTPIEADMTATIVGWENGNEENGENIEIY